MSLNAKREACSECSRPNLSICVGKSCFGIAVVCGRVCSDLEYDKIFRP